MVVVNDLTQINEIAVSLSIVLILCSSSFCVPVVCRHCGSESASTKRVDILSLVLLLQLANLRTAPACVKSQYWYARILTRLALCYSCTLNNRKDQT